MHQEFAAYVCGTITEHRSKLARLCSCCVEYDKRRPAPFLTSSPAESLTVVSLGQGVKHTF